MIKKKLRITPVKMRLSLSAKKKKKKRKEILLFHNGKKEAL